MNLIVDENISFAEEAFSQFGKVKLLHGRQITKDEIAWSLQIYKAKKRSLCV